MVIANFVPSAKPIVLGNSSANKCLILIHGLTLSGRQFMPIGEFLLANLGEDWQIILPTAPTQQVTWTGGQITTAWFDLPHGRFDNHQDEAGLNQANAYIQSLIDEQIQRGIKHKNIVIGGFSQGGALALLDKLGDFLQKTDKLNIFIAHGVDDKPIDISLAQNAVDILQNNGFEVDFKTYPMGHTIYEDELNDVVMWLSRY